MRHDWQATDNQGHYNECPTCGATYNIWEAEDEGTPVNSECPGTLKGVIYDQPVFIIDLFRSAPPQGLHDHDAVRFGYGRTLTEAKALLQRVQEYGFYPHRPYARIEAQQMNEPFGAEQGEFVFWFTWNQEAARFDFSHPPFPRSIVQEQDLPDAVTPTDSLPF